MMQVFPPCGFNKTQQTCTQLMVVEGESGMLNALQNYRETFFKNISNWTDGEYQSPPIELQYYDYLYTNYKIKVSFA